MKAPVTALVIASILLISGPTFAAAWVQVPSPVVNSDPQLWSVVAAGDNDVWAVGSSFSQSRGHTLIEHWDGSLWSVVRSVDPSQKANSLSGVAVVAPNNVWAVGSRVQGRVQQTLVEHWNGRKWQVVSSPNVVGDGNQSFLEAISVVAANDIWAVGAWSDSSANNHNLALHWDGVAWTIVPTPTVQVDVLFGVEAVANNDVWAVGRTGSGVNTDLQTLILHWDGTAWSVVPSPSVGTGGSVLRGVSAVSPDNVWAAGYSGFPLVNGQTLALNWDGSSWSVVPTSNRSPDQQFWAVIALAANNVWAVGEDYNVDEPLSENWTGAVWKTVAIPSSTAAASLYSITVTPNGTLWAVGSQASGAQAVIYERAP